MEVRTFLLFPPLLLFLLAILCEYTNFDIWWVSHFYDAGNQVWPFMRHWFFKGVLHAGGRRFVRLIGLIWLLGFILVSLRPKWRRYRKSLLYVLCGSAIGPIIVGAGKQLTHIYPPWDLQMFGSSQPYIRLFDPVPGQAPIGHAFPAGHASSGYCFFSLYFILRHHNVPYRVAGFCFGLFLGVVFGLAQQIRGAHFPSHDLFTLAICWYGALGMYALFYPQEWRRMGDATLTGENNAHLGAAEEAVLDENSSSVVIDNFFAHGQTQPDTAVDSGT